MRHPRPARGALCAVLLALGVLVGAGSCSAVLGIGDLSSDDLGGGNAASSSSGGVGGTGGAGGAPETECTKGDDCPLPTSECQHVACKDGSCVKTNLPIGTHTVSQLAGDCHKLVCDGAGNVSSLPDGNDAFNDANPCTDDTCSGDVPHNTPHEGRACSFDGGHVCDSTGNCIECDMDHSCPGLLLCSNTHCVPPECGDTMRDGNETDVDCGGDTCAPCGDGKHCQSPSDCTSHVCSGLPKSCRAPTCHDGVKNGSETGIDCGGAISGCPPCNTNSDCNRGSDCTSGVCTMGTCADPSCTDGLKNGSETDKDCGGPDCPGCPDGDHCVKPGDCSSGGCGQDGICSHCDNGKTDFGETDLDCGGTCKDGCSTGEHCLVAADCAPTLSCCNAKCGPTLCGST